MKAVLIGGQGIAPTVADQMVDAHDRFGMDIEVLGLALDDHSHGDSICGYPIICGVREAYEKFKKYEDVKIFFELYRLDIIPERAQLLRSLQIPDDKFANFIHPTALVGHTCKLGIGNVILANVVVNNCAVIGNFNHILSGALVGHDVVVGDNNYIAAHTCLGAHLELGNSNFIGLNSSIRNDIKIGDGTYIGMSSNVTKSLPDGVVAYGNPASVKPRIKNAV